MKKDLKQIVFRYLKDNHLFSKNVRKYALKNIKRNDKNFEYNRLYIMSAKWHLLNKTKYHEELFNEVKLKEYILYNIINNLINDSEYDKLTLYNNVIFYLRGNLDVAKNQGFNDLRKYIENLLEKYPKTY